MHPETITVGSKVNADNATGVEFYTWSRRPPFNSPGKREETRSIKITTLVRTGFRVAD